MEQAAASMLDWASVAEPKSDQHQHTGAQQAKSRQALRDHLQVVYGLHYTQGNKSLHKLRLILLPCLLFFLKNTM